MTAVWIILGILAAVGLLVWGILALPIDLVVALKEQAEFGIFLRILGKKISLDQQGDAPKKAKKSALAEWFKKALGISHLQSMEEMQKAVEQRGAAETLADTLKLIGEFAGDFIKLWQQCAIPKFRICAICGGEDAPLVYGTCCAVLYPLVSYMEQSGKLKAGNMPTIECDYDRPESLLEFELIFRLKVWHLLAALWRIIQRNVEKEVDS